MLAKTRSRSNREQKKFPAYVAKIRQCPCVVCGAQAECAHLRMSSAEYGKTNGRSDRWCLSLCPQCHRLGPDSQHARGERIWWNEKGIDPLPIASQLWEARDNLEKMQEICQHTRETK